MVNKSFLILVLSFFIFWCKVSATDYDELSSSPDYNIGRFLESDSPTQDKSIIYKNNRCYGTLLNYGQNWIATTCSCASVMDKEAVEDKIPSSFHTILIPKSEAIAFQHIIDLNKNGDKAKININPVVLSLRHPKCHVSEGLFQYNIALMRVEQKMSGHADQIHANLYEKVTLSLMTMFGLAMRPSGGCFVYNVDLKGKLKGCSIWKGKFELWPRESMKDILEQGTVCLEHSGDCPMLLGSPICCGSHKTCFGIISGKCWNCENMHLVYFDLILQENIPLEPIEKAWSDSLIIQNRNDNSDRKKIFWKSARSNASKISSILIQIKYFISQLFHQIKNLQK